MNAQLVNVLVSIVFSIAYLVVAMKVLMPFFNRISSPMTQAARLLHLGTIFGFGIILNDFSEFAGSAFYYNYQKSNLGMGLYYWMLFSLIAFIFSFLIFHLSYRIVNIVTKENETAELAKNNFGVAGLHLAVFISICLVVSKPLISWANGFVNVPIYPN
jgi:hypothetical protein